MSKGEENVADDIKERVEMTKESLRNKYKEEKRTNHIDTFMYNDWLEKRFLDLENENRGLKDFAIWMTGCGYDFCQHEYFIKQRDVLLRDDEMITTMNDEQLKDKINKLEGAPLLALFMALYSYQVKGKRLKEAPYEMVKAKIIDRLKNHSELLEIHKILMCPAECSPHTKEESCTIRLLKDIIFSFNENTTTPQQ
jgi:hypothetical protein